MNGREFLVRSEYLFRHNIFFEVYEERVASRDGVDVLRCHVNSQKYKPCEYRLSNWQLSNKMFDILFNFFTCLFANFFINHLLSLFLFKTAIHHSIKLKSKSNIISNHNFLICFIRREIGLLEYKEQPSVLVIKRVYVSLWDNYYSTWFSSKLGLSRHA